MDRFTNPTISLKNNRFNHKHGLVFYYYQLPCGEILTAIFLLRNTDYRDNAQQWIYAL